ncbi:MAG: HD domain-containing protein [Candidatus Diapherotrites archaeon]|uniref:HD domain-containing protein n=1 Tax=Candidatus Iainarchaeum sp. TaxID=3101447 RepID=A0A938YU12_9ARCH|nr:HD domain-containing protein [Candidatus Diapherotrites archaeon]
MNMEEARSLFDEYVSSEKIKMHCREVETIMKALAQELGEDEEKWAVAGLLHDMDCDIEPDIKNQARKVVEILRERTDCPEDVCHAILSHNEFNLGVKRESKLDFALSAADNISGLIYTYGLMKGTLDGMQVKGLKKKLKDNRFAASVRRDLILDIEKAGLGPGRFLEISISAMQGIAKEIGL